MKCKTFRPQRSLSVTIAQQLPSPTYAVAMSLYQIILNEAISNSYLKILCMRSTPQLKDNYSKFFALILLHVLFNCEVWYLTRTTELSSEFHCNLLQASTDLLHGLHNHADTCRKWGKCFSTVKCVRGHSGVCDERKKHLCNVSFHFTELSTKKLFKLFVSQHGQLLVPIILHFPTSTVQAVNYNEPLPQQLGSLT